jgi:hypothetical protein
MTLMKNRGICQKGEIIKIIIKKKFKHEVILEV